MRIITPIFQSGFALFFIFGRITCAAADPICERESVQDSILDFPDGSLSVCPLSPPDSFGVIEGDERSLQTALSMVYRNTHDYVAVLFYASWCPFSGTFKPSLLTLSSLYPSIPHFAIEESAIRPSILSKYGVHGFPTLFLMNSTMRIRYHGSRTLGSLVSFYGDVTGIKTSSSHSTSLGEIGHTSEHTKGNRQQESCPSCPFSWARSPENLLRQETYLALATVFVVLRLLYLSFPGIRLCAQFAWRRRTLNLRLTNLWERPMPYLNRVAQLFSFLKEPSKRHNLQGAISAKAWASKSLASVSFGEASSSRVAPVS